MQVEKTTSQEIAANIKLRLPCEIVTEHLLPIIRRELAQELVNRRKISQIQVAKILGVTQPAISNYIHTKSKLKGEVADSVDEIEKLARDFSEDLCRGRLTERRAIEKVCGLCIQMRNQGPICAIHGEEIESLQHGRCSLCLTDLTRLREGALGDYEIAENVRQALQLIEDTKELALLIPEIGMNITYAKPDAVSTMEVVGVPGRIRSIARYPRAACPPEFGGSSHVARAVLTMIRFQPSFRSAISLKYDPEVIEICKQLDLVVSFYDRSEEPIDVKSVEDRTIPWGIECAVKRSSEPPSVVYDTGDIGKEPLIFLFGYTPIEVAQLAAKIAKEYIKRTPSSRSSYQHN